MISLTVDKRVAFIGMNRPEVRNALDATGWRQLADAVQAVADSAARALVLSSLVEGSFCAGSNLAELAALVDDDEGRGPFRMMMRAALDPLATLAIPTVAVIDGDCFGAGVALALACDVRIAGPRARFCVPPARLGVSYPPEDVARLVSCVGKSQAGLMLYSALVLDGAEALRIGLADRLSASAADEGAQIAAQIAANAAESVTLLKRIVTGAASPEEANAGFDALVGSDALREGLRAFRERRAPSF